MSLIHPSTIAEAILSNLKGGERKTTEILSDLVASGGGITKQAFYAALRKLKEEEVVTVYGGRVSINTAWIRAMQELLIEMEYSHISADPTMNLPQLSQKESVSYVFSNTRHLDTFWGHSQTQIIKQVSVSEPVYSYDPHYWFYIARKETEKKLVENIVGEGRQFLMTVGGETFLDKALQAEFSGDFRQYHMQSIFPKRNYYVVVIGDYITEVWLDQTIADYIDEIYAKTKQADSDLQGEFEKLLTIKARHKIRISKNARKAETIRRKLKKNFFIRNVPE